MGCPVLVKIDHSKSGLVRFSNPHCITFLYLWNSLDYLDHLKPDQFSDHHLKTWPVLKNYNQFVRQLCAPHMTPYPMATRPLHKITFICHFKYLPVPVASSSQIGFQPKMGSLFNFAMLTLCELRFNFQLENNTLVLWCVLRHSYTII